jgi:3-deoxy-D-manno-octulosonic-acid transferase
MASSEGLLPVVWTTALLGAAAVASPWIALRLATDPRWREGLGERLRGWPEATVQNLTKRGWYWVHAASVGEVRMALRLATALEAGPSGAPVRLTAFTPAGRGMAREGRPGSCYAPLDLPFVVHRRAAALPMAHIAVETELWPNLLLALHRRRIPSFAVSARLSEGSYSRYRRLGWLARGVLSTMAGVMARDTESAERFVLLGVPREKVIVTGDLKLDLPEPPPADPAARFPPPGRVLLGASVHPGEEAPLLEFFTRVTPLRPEFTLLLAPRHLDRVPWFLERIGQWRLPYMLHSEARRTGGDASGRIYVVDTLGELPGLLHLAGAVFVGGTLVPIGGHNLMEPATAGKGVLFGPHTESVIPAAALLADTRGGVRVPDADALVAALEGLFSDGSKLEELSAGARRAASLGAGAFDRTVAALRAALGRP